MAAPAADALPAGLDVMSVGEFEPEVWIPATHPAAAGAAIGLAGLRALDVVHGPRRASPAAYDAWLARLRAIGTPRFAFTDPPFRNSLPITLAFAATGTRPTAVLTGPRRPASDRSPARHHPAIRPAAPTTWFPGA